MCVSQFREYCKASRFKIDENGKYLNFFLNCEEAYIYTGKDKGEITVSLADPSKNEWEMIKNAAYMHTINSDKLNELIENYLG